jgi:hypothetical protein
MARPDSEPRVSDIWRPWKCVASRRHPYLNKVPAGGCRRVDDGVEVTGELSEGVAESAAATGAAVSALVVGDDADVGVTRCQMICLATPTVPVAQQSMQENHRQIGDFGTSLSRHEGKPVGCGDGNRLCCYWVHQRANG